MTPFTCSRFHMNHPSFPKCCQICGGINEWIYLNRASWVLLGLFVFLQYFNLSFWTKFHHRHWICPQTKTWQYVNLVTKGFTMHKISSDFVFRLIVKYNSLMDFGPYVMIGLFLYEDFWKMISWLVLKLELSKRVIISLKDFFLFLLEDFLKIIFFHS
jgi:hypothetical protein